jgi:glyoxylase-like metal-dependent hydrolase (beta-lactamase superfamily II)
VKLNEQDVCLIDSGNDKDAGRKVRQILNANGWRLTAIYNTHSNADHIGGNKYLQGQTGCKIYAPGIDCAFTRHPVLEPSFLYGGYPCKELRHKFLMAQESDAQELTQESMPEGFEIIPLPGHFFDMVGFRTPDNVVYLADCLSSRETLDKYQIGFIYDVAAYLKTLEMVKSLRAKIFIPAHATATEDVADLAQYNISKVLEIADKIMDICREPLCFEAILQKLFAEYRLTMNFEQYVLVGSTVRSYLAWLKDTGRLGGLFENNMLLWQRV